MISQPVAQAPATPEPETQPTYTLSVVGGTSERTSYAAGESVTVTADEIADKVFTCWTATGIELDAKTAEQTSITFVMPANNVSLTAVFQDKTYKVRLPIGAEFVTEPENGSFAPGDTVQIRWENPEKYFVRWNFSQKVDGVLTDNPITFTMPAGDLVIAAESFYKTAMVALELEEPVADKPLPETAAYTINGTVYTVEITWYDGDTQVTAAKSGNTYRAVMTLVENIADHIVFSEGGYATVNGKLSDTWELVEKGVTVSFRFDIPESEVIAPVTGAILGNGSWIALALLTLGFAVCIMTVVVVQKKRRKSHNSKM